MQGLSNQPYNDCISKNFLQNNLLPSGEKRKTVKTLVIDSVDRHEAGIYICEATNGVGVSHVKAEAKIKLQVLCESFVCNLKWRQSSRFMQKHFLLQKTFGYEKYSRETCKVTFSPATKFWVWCFMFNVDFLDWVDILC